jgi:hypothetical protein
MMLPADEGALQQQAREMAEALGEDWEVVSAEDDEGIDQYRIRPVKRNIPRDLDKAIGTARARVIKAEKNERTAKKRRYIAEYNLRELEAIKLARTREAEAKLLKNILCVQCRERAAKSKLLGDPLCGRCLQKLLIAKLIEPRVTQATIAARKEARDYYTRNVPESLSWSFDILSNRERRELRSRMRAEVIAEYNAGQYRDPLAESVDVNAAVVVRQVDAPVPD